MEFAMISPRLFFTILIFPLLMNLASSIPALAFVDEPGKEGSFYSPVIRVVPENGFLLINSGNGILWVKATREAMPHLAKLPVGGLIDVVVVFQGQPNPPIIKSWKLASGNSDCDIFDGARCLTKEQPK
jgi:hypothetical protein